MNTAALAAALALAADVPYGAGGGVAPPTKKKPAKVQKNRARAKAARKAQQRRAR